ncbi:MAG: dCTP deaminase [Candidatus Latescibacteria bacterium]|nr:dCTP deaminase [Candidatus Latescibacterota bacterium]
MILSDRTIREEIAAGRLIIDPYDPKLVQPASLDLRLSLKFRVFADVSMYGQMGKAYIDTKESVADIMRLVEVKDGEPFMLPPRQFVLGSTVETVTLPADLVGRLEGRSSLGRIGVVIHSTAGYIDCGYSGQITLEISNLSPLPIALYPGMRIAQISFARMTTPAERPYGHKDLSSKYQGQQDPTPSKLFMDFTTSKDEGRRTKGKRRG